MLSALKSQRDALPGNSILLQIAVEGMPRNQSKQSADGPTNNPEVHFPLADLGQLGSFLMAMGSYETEADICYNAGAYLASCIMLAASIQGLLVLLTGSRPDEAKKAVRQVNKKLKLSSLLRWDLDELLKVAKQANWIPSELPPHPYFSLGDVSDTLSIERIRELRNLVHPGRLVKERGGITITKQELDTMHATCLAIYEHLAKETESL